jgi:type I restriction/modification specificity protein
MSEVTWKITSLSELGTFSRGKSKHRPRNDIKLFEGGTYPLVQTGDVKAANLYITKNDSYYNDFGLKQSKLWPAGTLCITIAANIAETAILSYPMCFPDSIVGFNANPEKSSELFVYYFFEYIKKEIQKSASGSIQDNINIDYLSKMRIKVPEKDYQDKIVEVLSSIDKKILLNNQINQELEDMAKALYDYWFVQFDFPDQNGKPYKSSGGKMVYNPELKREIPEGWGNSILGEFADLYQPKTISDKDMIEDGEYLVYGANGIIGRYSEYNHEDSMVTISCRGNCGIINITRPYSWITGNSMVVKPKDDIYNIDYISNLLLSLSISSVITGSVQKQLTRTSLVPLKVIIPNKEIIEKYRSITKASFEKRKSIQIEVEQLTQLRDWLLPMLMNGQVKVENYTD